MAVVAVAAAVLHPALRHEYIKNKKHTLSDFF
jgi:hypothetical protein